jgi:hypothetical protein
VITHYDVYFMKPNGDFVLDLTHCDGSNPTVVAARNCTVPMLYLNDLLTLPPRDSLIRVKVRAYNAKGTGQYSEVNTLGATVETIPTNLMVLAIDVPSTTNV